MTKDPDQRREGGAGVGSAHANNCTCINNIPSLDLLPFFERLPPAALEYVLYTTFV